MQQFIRPAAPSVCGGSIDGNRSHQEHGFFQERGFIQELGLRSEHDPQKPPPAGPSMDVPDLASREVAPTCQLPQGGQRRPVQDLLDTSFSTSLKRHCGLDRRQSGTQIDAMRECIEQQDLLGVVPFAVQEAVHRGFRDQLFTLVHLQNDVELRGKLCLAEQRQRIDDERGDGADDVRFGLSDHPPDGPLRVFRHRKDD